MGWNAAAAVTIVPRWHMPMILDALMNSNFNPFESNQKPDGQRYLAKEQSTVGTRLLHGSIVARSQ
eukprot:scaffold28086_cov83-Skeletonema_dohrnii-CCMP3373.AAC.1